MNLVGRIERMDRAERTKQDYKNLIRKFFRWLGREDIVDWIKIPPERTQGSFLKICSARKRSRK